jgi:hypothetical protein
VALRGLVSSLHKPRCFMKFIRLSIAYFKHVLPLRATWLNAKRQLRKPVWSLSTDHSQSPLTSFFHKKESLLLVSFMALN